MSPSSSSNTLIYIHHGPVIWDYFNTRHIFHEHQERNLIEEAMRDPYQITEWQEKRNSYSTLGRTATNDWLFIAWVPREGGKYPIHVRHPGRRLIQKILGDTGEDNNG